MESSKLFNIIYYDMKNKLDNILWDKLYIQTLNMNMSFGKMHKEKIKMDLEIRNRLRNQLMNDYAKRI